MFVNPDTQLGRYQIRSQIGLGGMGEVYLAQDTDLDRPVALKILPESLTQDEDRLRRFRQEARAASKLNHPNVAHIYEIGEADGRHFIAMEYVKGETLRIYMLHANFHLIKTLDIGAQVAAALAAAHAEGIVHRDVKPENIIVQGDGLVKVLDFGLAKMESTSANRRTSSENVSTLIHTNPGLVMGTASYMSPEQARGLSVDARTDIFSLGVVLYEMVTRRRPFQGATTSDVLAALLERTPPPLDQLKPDAPQELERIVSKALEKDADQRYQTIKDMALDLRKLKQRLEGQSESSGALLSDVSGAKAMSSPSTPSAMARRSTAASQPTLVGQPHSTSSVEYVVSGIKRHKLVVALIGALFIAVLTAAGFGLFKIISQRQAKAPPSFQAMNITKLTSTGKSRNAAISPDGKYVAYSVYDGGQESLWVRQVATNSNVQIVSPSEANYIGLTFTPDGNYIYYVQQAGATVASVALYQIPVLGGNPRKLLTNIQGSVSFSPDGSRFVFGRWSSDGVESSLIVANADGSGEHVLGTRKGSDYFGGGVAVIHPTWSPDGETIVCSIATSDAGANYASLVEVRVADGAQKLITSQRWSSVGQAAWLPDGRGLVFVASNMQSGSPAQTWQLSFPSGEASKITNDTNEYSGVGVTHDSNTLVTSQKTSLNSVWVATPNADASHATRVSADNTGEPGISWTPDNRIVHSSRASGNVDVWSVNVDGTNPRQLTFDQHTDNSPAVTPDGRHIVFSSDRTGSYNVWRMDIDGGNPLQLTRSNLADDATCSPDGRWVIFSSYETGKYTLWKVSIDGGEQVQLTDYSSFGAVVSPDGKLIACIHAEQTNEPEKIAIIPFEGGQPKQLIELPPNAYGWLRWSPDGRAISFINNVNGVGNIWNVSLNEGSPKQLTDFKSDRIIGFNWSRDGKQLAVMRSTQIRDIVMIRNFK